MQLTPEQYAAELAALETAGALVPHPDDLRDVLASPLFLRFYAWPMSHATWHLILTRGEIYKRGPLWEVDGNSPRECFARAAAWLREGREGP